VGLGRLEDFVGQMRDLFAVFVEVSCVAGEPTMLWKERGAEYRWDGLPGGIAVTRRLPGIYWCGMAQSAWRGSHITRNT
jgi:hypothetical protein